MALSLNDFGKAVVATGLLPADELKSLVAGHSSDARPKDAAALAKLLLKKGHLTRHQADELLAGRGLDLVLGEYVIHDKIGAGGMGQVLKAVHRKMGRAVALKLMSTSAMKDEAAIKRFHREVKAAARLEHENIVTAHAAGEARGMHYLVMQYVEGSDLSGRVKKDGPLPVDLAMDCICQSARGLAYAHSEGIIHRDIKPANLLLDKKGVVKILDMGLARIDGGDHDGLTGTEQVLGTVDYMSPEQAISTRDCDARADIYSLGCTLWYLLTATKMYTGDSPIQRLMQHREATLPSLLATRDDIPWALEKLFHKMVAKKPDDRIQTMDEVVHEIEHIRGGPESSRTSGLEGDTNLGQFAITVGGKESSRSGTKVKVAAGKSSTTEESTVGQGDSLKVPLPGGGENPPWKNVKVLAGVAAAAFLLLLTGVWVIVRDKDKEVAQNIASERTKVQRPPEGTVETRITPAVPNPNDPAGRSDLRGPKTSSISQTEILTSPNFVWSEPERIAQGMYTPFVSGDGLTLVDVGAREGGLGKNDLWLFERKSPYEPFSATTIAVNLGPAVNSESDERHASLSTDGLTLLFSSDRPGGMGGLDLWLATRKSRGKAFELTTNMGPPVNTPASEMGGAFSGDALTLVFISTQNGGRGGPDLWQTHRKDLRSPFEKPQNLGPMINSTIAESHPWLSADGRVLIFGTLDTAKDESGRAKRVPGSGELWMAVRPSVDAPFAERQNLAPPITLPDADNGMPSVTADGKLMFFNSKRPGNNKDALCWISRRVPRAASEAVADPDRNAAEWALSVGGRVSVFEPGKSSISVSSVAGLPKGLFLLQAVTLPMTDTTIGDEDLACLAALSDLSALEFGRVKGFTDAGLKHLSGLIQLKKLTFFDNSQITDAGMKHLTGLKKLEELGLVATQVSDQGLREFIGCPLARLNVGGRPAADKMMPVIAEFRDLLDLGLHGNVITDNNMLGLQSLTKLQYLGLMGASVTDEGLKTIATLKVKDLHLQGLKFTDGGLKNLEGMTSLAKLSIKDTKATAAGIDALQKALPGCKIRWDDPSKSKTAAPAGK